MDGYFHKSVVKAMPGGVWGLPGIIPQYITPNSEFTQSFTYTLPEAAFVEYTIENNTPYCSTVDVPGQNEGHNIPANINLIGYVAEQDSDVFKRTVINAAEERLWNLTYLPNLPRLSNFKLSPNPGSEMVSVNMVQDLSDEVKVEVIDFNGRVLKSANYQPGAGQVALFLDMSGLNAGIYLVRVSAANWSVSEKWLKQ